MQGVLDLLRVLLIGPGLPYVSRPQLASLCGPEWVLTHSVYRGGEEARWGEGQARVGGTEARRRQPQQTANINTTRVWPIPSYHCVSRAEPSSLSVFVSPLSHPHPPHPSRPLIRLLAGPSSWWVSPSCTRFVFLGGLGSPALTERGGRCPRRPPAEKGCSPTGRGSGQGQEPAAGVAGGLGAAAAVHKQN